MLWWWVLYLRIWLILGVTSKWLMDLANAGLLTLQLIFQQDCSVLQSQDFCIYYNITYDDEWQCALYKYLLMSIETHSDDSRLQIGQLWHGQPLPLLSCCSTFPLVCPLCYYCVCVNGQWSKCGKESQLNNKQTKNWFYSFTVAVVYSGNFLASDKDGSCCIGHGDDGYGDDCDGMACGHRNGRFAVRQEHCQ